MSRIEEAIRRSSAEFRSTVWPHFSDALGGGELLPVESVTESGFAKLLDTLAMTDAWQVVNETGMRGLATRVQWTSTAWCSWTVRYKLPSGRETEYHKLLREGPWQRPHYIIQAYVCDGQLLDAAGIQTRDLQVMLLNGWHDEPRRNPQDGTLFIPVWWKDVEARGLNVIRPARARAAVA